jgi:hypothetical protein
MAVTAAGGGWARRAARNNAEWCAAMAAAHGVAGRFDPDAWVSLRRSPPLYPDAVTLTHDVRPDGLLSRIDDSAGCSVKDSFATLDLSTAGFELLFEASWICRPADSAAPVTATPLSWAAVRKPADLAEWGAAHGGGELFRPALLADPAVVILGAHRSGRLVGGAIANRSSSVVGISNLFAAAGQDPDEVWASATAAVAGRFAGLPLVGYEAGDSLAAARRAGFDTCGPLRVWLKPEPAPLSRGWAGRESATG